MSKPIKRITLTTNDRKSVEVNAVFDTSSFYSIIREDLVPSPNMIARYSSPDKFGNATKGGHLSILGTVNLTMTIGKKMIQDEARVSPQLRSDFILGAKTMQSWDISIKNKKGNTKITIAH